MIAVEQQHMAVFDEHGDPVRRGDCLRACIASIFEASLDEVPHFVDDEDWYGSYTRWVRERGFVVAGVRIHVDDDDPLKLTGHPIDGITWVATVKSPRGKARCAVCKGDGVALEQWIGADEGYVKYETPQPCVNCETTGLEPSLHAVVMCGGDLVWDPHPLREMGHLGFVSGEWFIALEPARLQLVSENEATQRSSI